MNTVIYQNLSNKNEDKSEGLRNWRRKKHLKTNKKKIMHKNY